MTLPVAREGLPFILALLALAALWARYPITGVRMAQKGCPRYRWRNAQSGSGCPMGSLRDHLEIVRRPQGREQKRAVSARVGP